MALECPRSIPCYNQSDYDDISFTVIMLDQKQEYVPSFKMAHYNWFRVKWLSFKSPLAPPFVLFLSVNSLGKGKQDQVTSTNASYPFFPSTYTISMPIEQNQRIAYDSSADPYRWIAIPPSTNLRKFTFYAWPDLLPQGAAPPGFITPLNPVTFELEFRCSMPNFMS